MCWVYILAEDPLGYEEFYSIHVDDEDLRDINWDLDVFIDQVEEDMRLQIVDYYMPNIQPWSEDKHAYAFANSGLGHGEVEG